MKRSERESINRESVNVTRSTSEPEDIDLAAEATESAPAKSLEPEPGLEPSPDVRLEKPARRPVSRRR